MVSTNALKLQQSPFDAVVPGSWQLVPDRAVTLLPGQPGVLRVDQGRVWATLNGPHQGPANDWGDVVLGCGQQLQLLPGQNVVVEAYTHAVNEPVYFSWEPSQAPPAGDATTHPVWLDPLARPLIDLQPELARWARLLAGWMGKAASLPQWFVAGRGRVLSPLEFNQP